MKFIRFHSDSKLVLAGTLLVWGLLSTCFILRTPDYAFTHDIRNHFQYTRILVQEHRLPHPYEGAETFEPPLFYWLASHFFADRGYHPRAVRLAAAFFGAVAICCIAWTLERMKTSPIAQLLLLLFISTTPAFLFLFSTYNTDALAVLCSMLLVILTIAIVQGARPWHYVAWTLIATAAFYTKYTVFFTAPILFGISTLLVIRGYVRAQVVIRLGGCLVSAFVLFSPWLLGHNYRLTGHLFPKSRVVTDSAMPREIMLPHSAWRTLLTPPGITHGEWRDPFVHLWEAAGHKKGSYLAYQMSSSVFGEFVFDQLPVALSWTILVIHILFAIASLSAIPLNGATRLAALVILGSQFNGMSYVFYFPVAGLMDFRYQTWTWIPFSVLISAFLISRRESMVSKYALGLLGLGAISQTLFMRLLMQ